jgi:hypothetical protein
MDTRSLKKGVRPLKSYVVVGERLKTLSATKSEYKGKELLETPQGCYLDILKNYLNLLAKHPEWLFQSGQEAIHLDIHPAVGPLFSTIIEKFKKGAIESSSYLKVHLAEILIDGLHWLS